MIKNIYAMYDKQVGSYLAPLTLETDAEAIRVFTTWVNADDKQNNVSLYPEHFSMWKLGTVDTTSGNLETEQKELITGNACKVSKKKYTIEDLIKIIGERQNA
jgi:hypothetical protein